MAVRAFYEEYASLLGFPGSEILYKIFDVLYDDEDDMKILQALPGNVESISKASGIPEERLKPRLEELWRKGGVQGGMGYYALIKGLIVLRDMSVMWPQTSQEYWELWEEMFTKEHERHTAFLNSKNYPPAMRVLPVNETVDSESRILDVDSAAKVFQDARVISAVDCACRLQAKKVGRGQNCPAPETANCFATNRIADMIIARGIGTEISLGDALKRLKECEDAGLVHMARNNVAEDMFMCNCCSCCCHGLHMINDGSYTGAFAPSRFRVTFDADLCTGCGECESRCQFQAITVNGIAQIDFDKCFGCGNCVTTCPVGALVLTEIRPVDSIRTAKKR
ncbi:MAG: 4Fe-4S binding protein [Desulfobacterales bacterium]